MTTSFVRCAKNFFFIFNQKIPDPSHTPKHQYISERATKKISKFINQNFVTTNKNQKIKDQERKSTIHEENKYFKNLMEQAFSFICSK